MNLLEIWNSTQIESEKKRQRQQTIEFIIRTRFQCLIIFTNAPHTKYTQWYEKRTGE